MSDAQGLHRLHARVAPVSRWMTREEEPEVSKAPRSGREPGHRVEGVALLALISAQISCCTKANPVSGIPRPGRPRGQSQSQAKTLAGLPTFGIADPPTEKQTPDLSPSSLWCAHATRNNNPRGLRCWYRANTAKGAACRCSRLGASPRVTSQRHAG